jgi:hypothetical protein
MEGRFNEDPASAGSPFLAGPPDGLGQTPAPLDLRPPLLAGAALFIVLCGLAAVVATRRKPPVVATDDGRYIVTSVAAKSAACYLPDQPAAGPPREPARLVTSAWPPQSRLRSVGQKLAVIETGDPSAANTGLADLFDRKLDDLTRKFPEDRESIAGMTLKAQELLRQAGNEESLYSVLTAVDASYPGGLGVEYAEMAAAYVTLRNGGR